MNKVISGRVEVYLPDSDPIKRHHCQLTLHGDVLHLTEIFSNKDGDFLEYSGKQVEPGHFELKASDAVGDVDATLHGRKGSHILEGYWMERDADGGKDYGMWRIHLEPPPC